MTDPLLFAKIRREVYDSMNAKEERRIKSDRHQWDDNPAMNDWDNAGKCAVAIIKIFNEQI